MKIVQVLTAHGQDASEIRIALQDNVTVLASKT